MWKTNGSTSISLQQSEEQKSKLKVCIVSAILPPAYGGAEVAAFRYAKRLDSDPDSEVIVIGWDRTGAYKESNLNYKFVYPVRFPENPKDAEGVLIYFQQLYHLWNCFFALLKPMWKFRDRYDYIHNFNSGFAFNRVSIFIGKLLGKKIITETSLIGDDDPLSLGRFPTWREYFKPKLIRYKFYKMADRFISKSDFMTEIFRKSEIPMEKVMQVPYPVDTGKFRPLGDTEKKELRSKLGIWSEGIIIIFVGGINVRKGVHLLVESFTSVCVRFPDAKLLIVGPTYKYDKKYISDLKEKIEKSPAPDRIILTEKNVSNVEEYMQCSDIFVLPSKQEGFPISIIEAMSTGLAVIASDIPEIANVQIKDNVDGLLFAAGDAARLSDSMCKLLSDKEQIIALGKTAREKALANWSTEIVDRKYREIYSSI